jgi:hypothetical protein
LQRQKGGVGSLSNSIQNMWLLARFASAPSCAQKKREKSIRGFEAGKYFSLMSSKFNEGYPHSSSAAAPSIATSGLIEGESQR